MTAQANPCFMTRPVVRRRKLQGRRTAEKARVESPVKLAGRDSLSRQQDARHVSVTLSVSIAAKCDWSPARRRNTAPGGSAGGRGGQWISRGITFGGWRIWKQTDRSQGLARIAVAC